MMQEAMRAVSTLGSGGSGKRQPSAKTARATDQPIALSRWRRSATRPDWKTSASM